MIKTELIELDFVKEAGIVLYRVKIYINAVGWLVVCRKKMIALEQGRLIPVCRSPVPYN